MVGPGRLEEFDDLLPDPPPGWVNVEVIGCGVCHTDIGYLYGGVPTARGGPIVLGHEIVGRVLDRRNVPGRTVIVPAVSPCGECRACRRGRPTACRGAKMPGNHHDGGFATHAQVPSRWLCDVPELPHGQEAWPLAAIADAVSTAYQAIVRCHLGAHDVAVVVGAGGVGRFVLELAAAAQATTLALDVSEPALDAARARGALAALDVRGLEPKAVRAQLAAALQARGLDPEGWHVFECSGTPAGQALAFGLLTRGATLSVVGFSPESLPIRLSNLMALDAEAYGNWGCDPHLFADVLARCLAGQVRLADAVEPHALADAPAVLERAHRQPPTRRPVLLPSQGASR